MTDYTEINQIKRYCNVEVIEKVANELEIDEKLVQSIFDAQSKFTAKVVSRGAFESVTYIYLGKVQAKLRAISKMLSNKGKKR